MKKIRILLAILLCACLLAGAAAAEEEDIDLDELLNIEVSEIEEAAVWTFPVALEDLDPEFIRLANKHYLLDKSYVPEPLVTIKALKKNKDGSNANGGMLKVSGTMQLQETCAAALIEMADAARADGYNLYLKSAYRSWTTQNTMYNNRLKKNKGKDDGWVSKAGASDHQTGLGCDVVPKNWTDRGMNERMAKEKECIWMAEHCQEFGFILRYPSDKEDVTEINYEPWHMRYVGIPAAEYIMANGLCLEEFTGQLQAAIQDYLARGGDPAKVEAYLQTPTDQ